MKIFQIRTNAEEFRQSKTSKLDRFTDVKQNSAGLKSSILLVLVRLEPHLPADVVAVVSLEEGAHAGLAEVCGLVDVLLLFFAVDGGIRQDVVGLGLNPLEG